MQNNFIIENKKIGDENPCFLIAEIGSNHNRDKNTVFKLIDACLLYTSPSPRDS